MGIEFDVKQVVKLDNKIFVIHDLGGFKDIKTIPLNEDLVQFVHDVFEQNIETLHGSPITINEWKKYIFGEDADPYEQHYIILADEKPAAWLKLNGLNSDNICISMLVVDDKFKRQGIGSYAVKYTEEYAVNNNKKAIHIQTTNDNLAATHCYLKQGYQILKVINYAVGDGILRDGYEFVKKIQPTK